MTKVGLFGLALALGVVVSLLVHLTFFAAKGERYTARDGQIEKNTRIAADMELRQRIEALEAWQKSFSK
jgi:hypothetical protein